MGGLATFPQVLGWDLAGSVAAVGENVSQWSVGDPVLGFSAQLAGRAIARKSRRPRNNGNKMATHCHFIIHLRHLGVKGMLIATVMPKERERQ
jgi:threonine dehydrogenase-like Zn-dependent dehydrogenase